MSELKKHQTKLIEVSQHLGWQFANQNDESDSWPRYVFFKNNQKIHINEGKDKDKVEFSPSYRTEYENWEDRQNRLKICVSLTRDAASIARDIERRLLPEYNRRYEYTEKWHAARIAENEAKNNLVLELARKFNGKGYLKNGLESNSVQSFSGQNFQISINGQIELKIEHLDQETLINVLEVIAAPVAGDVVRENWKWDNLDRVTTKGEAHKDNILANVTISNLRQAWQQAKKEAKQSPGVRAIVDHLANLGIEAAPANVVLILQQAKEVGLSGLPFVHFRTREAWAQAGRTIKEGEFSKVSAVVWEGDFPRLALLFHESQVVV